MDWGSIAEIAGPVLGGIAGANAGEDPELIDARVRQIDAQIEDARERLILERDRLALEQQKTGFNAEIQKRQLEIELALAAIEQARQSTPNRDQEIAVRQAGMQQRSADTGQTMQALNNVVASFQGAVKR